MPLTVKVVLTDGVIDHVPVTGASVPYGHDQLPV